jgi:RraA famliy
MYATADLCDHHPDLRVLAPLFRDYGGRAAFHGAVHTLRVADDNSLVREALETPGRGRVLVVDGGGSLRCALLGDRLGQLAMDNGWSGVVVHGCVRDAAVLATLHLGVRALATHPRKSAKHGRGETGVVLEFAGVTLRPGDWLYADADGLVLATQPLEL